MKKHFIHRIVVAGILLLTVPASLLAQKQKEASKDKKEMETIVITRKGDAEGKTVIEINGDQIRINGKDADDLKDADVRVHRSKVRDIHALVAPPPAPGAPPAPGVWNFNWDDGAVSLFSEDSNRAMLGVITDSDDKGARITSVSKGSAAEKSGLKEGDVITRIGNEKVEDAEDVSEEVRKHKPGDKITLTILRDGKEQKVEAELGKWKGVQINGNNMRIMTPDRVMPFEPNDNFNFRMMAPGVPKLGMSVQDDEDGKGVKVLDVDDDSNAAKAGIKEGDVITGINDKTVSNVDEVRSEIRQSREKASMNFKVLRNGKTQTIEVRVPRRLKTADL